MIGRGSEAWFGLQMGVRKDKNLVWFFHSDYLYVPIPVCLVFRQNLSCLA